MEKGESYKNRLKPCFDISLNDLEGEQWRDCLGFDGIYSISNYGRVKSEARYDNRGRLIKSRILKQSFSHKSACTVKFSVGNIKSTRNVMTLVGEVFLRQKKHSECYFHKNKDVTDNRLSNIDVATYSKSTKRAYDIGVNTDWGIGENAKRISHEKAKSFDTYENGVLIARICSCCFKELNISEFYYRSDSNTYRAKCKNCELARAGVIDIGKSRHRKELSEAGLRYCSVCKELKNIEIDFGKSKHGFLGKDNTCKACRKKLNEKYRLSKD